jgi:hypothetical protein
LLTATSAVEVLDRGAYEPVLKPAKDHDDQWRTIRSPVVTVCGVRLEVEVGFVTDFATRPWWARGKFSAAGRHAVGAIFHDYLLQRCNLPRWQCDMLLYLLLRAEGTPSLEATIFWLAVRTRTRGPRGI